MKTNFRFFLFLTFIISFSQEIKATHVPGGNITYECVGSNSYIITLTVFEDCSGTQGLLSGPQTLTITNSCGFNNPSTLQLPADTSYEISQICTPQLPNTTCQNGGTLPGIRKYVFRNASNPVTLPGGCHDWTIYWEGCCRNGAINLSAQDGYYFEAVINNTNTPCNSSPVIQANPVPYNCINVNVVYNFSVTEPDGDSLHYSFISARELPFGAVPTTVPYAAGYSPTSPINGITLDPNTVAISPDSLVAWSPTKLTSWNSASSSSS